MGDIDCRGVDNPTCPGCGCEWQDDDAVVQNAGEMDGYTLRCDECGTVYNVCPEFSVTFSSEALTPVVGTTLDGTEVEGYSDMCVNYCGADFMPPDGKGYRITDENGRKAVIVPIASVRERSEP